MDTEKGNGNGNTVLLTVIGVATLLVALVGATFAYFSATITNNSQESVVLTTAAPVGLEYVATKQVELTNIIPGQSESGTFTVQNPGTSTVAQEYDLELIIDENALNTNKTAGADYSSKAEYAAADAKLTKQLLVSVTGAMETAGTDSKSSYSDAKIVKCTAAAPCDYTDGTTNAAGHKDVIVQKQRIEIGEVQKYTINVNFADLGVNQNENQNKTFRAHIDIANATSVK